MDQEVVIEIASDNDSEAPPPPNRPPLVLDDVTQETIGKSVIFIFYSRN